MVQFGKLPPRRRPASPYDPFSLVQLEVNGRATTARPVEWNEVQAHANTADDVNGQPIYPTSCVTQCPECGDALTVPLSAPVSAPVRVNCLDLGPCRLKKRPAEVAVLLDPFRNPFLEGLMSVGDVDAGLVGILDIPPPPTGTVSDRMMELEP